MSCKTSIDDIQQLASTIENEYDIQAINRTQELNQRLVQLNDQKSFLSLLYIDGNIQYNQFHNA
jgi:hypothetical protein